MRSILAGRFSRAAVFAGLASCGGPDTSVKAPDGTSQTAAGTGTVRGVVRDEAGDPVASFKLTLGGDLASTNADGVYTFENVPAGEHFLYYNVSTNPRHGEEARTTLVKAGAVTRVDIQLPPPVPHKRPPPDSPKMPYGAPPSRRRSV